jgi:integrase
MNRKEHKTAWHGHRRTIYVGPRAQEIVHPFLGGRAVDAFLFSPREAEADRRERMHAERVTPVSCGNGRGTNRKRHPKWEPGDCYDVDSYRRAIQRGCVLAGVPSWHPHQLRHNSATMLRKEFGIDTARIILGHKSAAITEVYAELDHGKAVEVIERVG